MVRYFPDTSELDRPSRRRVLTALVAGAGIPLAGCVDDATSSNDDSSSAGDDSAGGDVASDDTETDSAGRDDPFEVETVVDGANHPWGLAFLPDDGRLLVTERAGALLIVDRESVDRTTDDGAVETVPGTPAVHAVGQGGLLDVAVDPAYPADQWVYLTYVATNDAGESTTHVGRGRLDPDAPELTEFETLHAAEPFVDSNGHYGSRVIVGRDGALYVTVGDRQNKEFGPEHVSQDATNELGTTLRLHRDGSIPEDNPFVDDPDVADAIYSYGHRNAQGMTIHPETGEIWQSEHGERDGDEITVVERGGNHGWPIAHYGCAYGTDDPVGDEPHERDDTVDPVYYWECGSGGFPPSGATFYDGEAFSEWDGDLFIGNLAGRYLGRFRVDGHDVTEVDPLLDGRDWRIRDVAVGPDEGHLYVAVDDVDAPVVRLTPE